MFRTLLLPSLLSVAAGCQQEYGECAGYLRITVPLPDGVPEQIRIIYNGETVVDECTPVSRGPVTFVKEETSLVVEEGSFGYTPPDTFSLEVIDLGDCTGTIDVIVEETRAVDGAPHDLCAVVDQTL